MIELQNVSKVFPTRRGAVRALDEVSLRIEAGEFVAVRGPSGCGKSTLLSLVGGLALPTSGTVTVDGRTVSGMSAGERAKFRTDHIGFVFQMFHLLPYLTVLENVLSANATLPAGVARESAIKLLADFGLSPRTHHRPGQLSAGERQRVALARALLNRPKLLLADEPTGNLDPQNAAAVLGWLAEFHRQGGTILLVTHEEQAAARTQRTILLDQGRLVTRVE